MSKVSGAKRNLHWVDVFFCQIKAYSICTWWQPFSFSKCKITKPVSARTQAFKIVCLSVPMWIYDDQHKVSCPTRIYIRFTNRRKTCPSRWFVRLLVWKRPFLRYLDLCKVGTFSLIWYLKIRATHEAQYFGMFFHEERPFNKKEKVSSFILPEMLVKYAE